MRESGNRFTGLLGRMTGWEGWRAPAPATTVIEGRRKTKERAQATLPNLLFFGQRLGI